MLKPLKTYRLLKMFHGDVDQEGLGSVGAVFLDLWKAFETVNHSVLLNKLWNVNLSMEFINLLKSYLSSHSQLVKMKNHNSNPVQLSTDVPQGSVLGPILFSMYINDLPSVCDNCDIIMYADDTVILSHEKTPEEAATKLTNAMLLITDWLKLSCLHFNFSKTTCMFFSKKTQM